MKYSDKLQDPRWQKKRLEILNRDEWTCVWCCDSETTLHVHHLIYSPGVEPWDIPNKYLITICDNCHQVEHEERPHAESKLLHNIKLCRFNYNDIDNLAEAFFELQSNMDWIPDVIATIIKHAFSSHDIMKEIGDKYFKSLSSKNKNMGD